MTCLAVMAPPASVALDIARRQRVTHLHRDEPRQGVLLGVEIALG